MARLQKAVWPDLSKSKKARMVGTGRFELPTPRTPSECSTRLSHVPTGRNRPHAQKRRWGCLRDFTPGLAFLALRDRLFLKNSKLDFLLYRINPVDQHPHPLSHAVDLAAAQANDFARVFVISVAVVAQRVERHQTLHEKIGQFHEESILGHADDQAVEILSHPVRHELDLLPLHQFAFGLVSAALRLAGFFGDIVQFLNRDGPAFGLDGFTMGRVITAFRPWRT